MVVSAVQVSGVVAVGFCAGGAGAKRGLWSDQPWEWRKAAVAARKSLSDPEVARPFRLWVPCTSVYECLREMG
jgi:hypothetical protein